MVSIDSVKAACNLVKTFSNKQLESKIFDRIDLLEKKVDMVLIRDLLAANAALDDIKAVGSASPEAIAHVRKLYMGNTGLPLDQKTYGIDNSKIVVASYLGLLQIGIIQGEDKKMLCRYILHMFATGEQIVYKELLNNFYQSNYVNICATFVKQTEQRKEYWQEEKVFIAKYKRTLASEKAIDPVWGFRGIGLRMAVIHMLADKTASCMNYVHKELDAYRDQAIAETCAEKAKEQLNQKDMLWLK